MAATPSGLGARPELLAKAAASANLVAAQTMLYAPAADADLGRNPQRLPLSRRFQVLAILASALLLGAAILVMLDRRQGAHFAHARATVSEMQMLSQRIATASHRASLGEPAALDVLHATRQRFQAALGEMRADSEPARWPTQAAPANARTAIDELTRAWNGMQRNVERIIAQRTAVLAMRQNRQAIAAAGSRLGELAQRLSAAAAEQRTDPALSTLARQLESNLAAYQFGSALRILSADPADTDAQQRLAANIRRYRESLNQLLDAGGERLLAAPLATPLRDAGEALRRAFNAFATGVSDALGSSGAVGDVLRASREISNDSELLLQKTQPLGAAYAEGSAANRFIWGAVIAAALAFACLLLIGKTMLDDAERRAFDSQQDALRDQHAHRHTQQAILRLLDEMGNLAQGDLTVRANVTEELTGAIADSMNYAVDELRRLVSQIIAATTQLADAGREAQTISGDLLNASQRQSQEIKDTNGAVAAVSSLIGRVSDRAAQSAKVAGESLDAARQGSDAVRLALVGMDAIREQIQDTAKRIKRLGESSQEIGEIVDLISDITERTNVLALNAAIQASSAGAAGRGFSLVAEEVQRLAERSAQATRQISAIVKTIQADTQDATSAMERSTQAVVEQAGLADDVGQALARIDLVSRQLAALNAAISAAMQDQTRSADRIRNNMGDILRITELTTDGTRRTADCTARLAQLAQELKQSVAGFKLS